MNCHYVSRLLTKPWEDGNRFLHFYDFVDDKFGKRPSLRLFAQEDLNSRAVEDWLNKYIETPLGAIRQSIAYGELTKLEQDWKSFRAAILMVILQGLRGGSLRNVESRDLLESLASYSDSKIDEIVSVIRSLYDLRFTPTISNDNDEMAVLYFSSNGLFPVVLEDPSCRTGYSFGTALAMNVNCAFVLTPKEREAAIDVSNVPDLLQRWSVGLSNARFAVLPPGLLEQVGKEKARADLRTLRASNDDIASNISAVRQLHLDAAQILGIDIELDHVGRIRR